LSGWDADVSYVERSECDSMPADNRHLEASPWEVWREVEV
jgi:hypothetical protein